MVDACLGPPLGRLVLAILLFAFFVRSFPVCDVSPLILKWIPSSLWTIPRFLCVLMSFTASVSLLELSVLRVVARTGVCTVLGLAISYECS